MIITVSSVRGSPGVTSWSLLLAAAWPHEYGVDRVVLEADVDGGVLGARYGFGVDPGVVSLIAALRRTDTRQVDLAEHGRRAGDGVWVVPGPETSEQADRVWHGSAEAVAEYLADDHRVWIVDVGRARATSPVEPLLAASAFSLVVTRAGTEDLVQVPSRVAYLRSQSEASGVLVVGKTQHSREELAAFVGTRRVWMVAADEHLPALAVGAMSAGRARRSMVWRAAIAVAADIAAKVTERSTWSTEVAADRVGGGGA